MDDLKMQSADKPLGKTVRWSKEEVTDEAKHIFLGTTWRGTFLARDKWVNNKGKEITIYKFRLLDSDDLVSVFETFLIKEAMEEGDRGEPIPLKSIVEFQHHGMKQGKDKANNPYHVIKVFFAPASPTFQKAASEKAANEKADEAGY